MQIRSLESQPPNKTKHLILFFIFNMSPIGMPKCPECNEDMSLRIGRSWYNIVCFYCSCGEILEI